MATVVREGASHPDSIRGRGKQPATHKGVVKSFGNAKAQIEHHYGKGAK